MPIAQRPVIFSIASGYRAPCTVICDAALSISRRSSEESSTATAPIFSSRRCSLVVPGIGTIHGFWASSQGQRDLSRCRFLLCCNRAKQINQGLIRFHCLRREARESTTKIRAAELSIFVHLSCKESLT